MSGTFYGLGLGPGDPELITLKSWRILSMAEVIAYPVGRSGASMARRTAAPFIPEDVVELPLLVPFGAGPEETEKAYAEAAGAIARHLEEGRDVAYICMGDPLFYSSYIYLAAKLHERHDVAPVSGVSAPTACAASAGRPLAKREEIVKILPATADAGRLRAEIAAGPATFVFLKAGSRAGVLREMLAEAGLAESAFAITRTDDGEEARPLTEAGEALPYFTTIIAFSGEAS